MPREGKGRHALDKDGQKDVGTCTVMLTYVEEWTVMLKSGGREARK